MLFKQKRADATALVTPIVAASCSQKVEKLQEALRLSEEKYNKTFHMSPDSININRLEDGMFVSINKVFAQILGYSEEEIIGKTSIELNIWDDITSRVALVEELKKHGKVENLEARFRSKAGEIRYGLMSATLIDLNGVPHICSITRDITANKKTELVLKESERKLKEAQHLAKIGSWEWDINSDTFSWSEELFHINGRPIHESEPHYAELSSFYTPECWDLLQMKIQDAITYRKRYELELEVIPHDGHPRWHIVTGEPVVDGQGKVVRLRGTAQDVTDRKRGEQERLRLLEQIQQNQKLESLGVLAGGIAHDFNNLLGGIFGYVDLALCQSSDEKVSNYLSKTLRRIDQAKALTQQLLTFAKGGTPRKDVSRLFPFVQEAAQFVLSGSSVSCTFEFPQDLWACDFDKNQIGQVIDNIVMNARQATEPGGAIKIAAENVTIKENEHLSLSEGSYVKVSISDTGTGISGDVLPRVFDPFFSTKMKHAGLGLAISYSIVKRHRGVIEVDSALGKGSTFRVYLPAVSRTAEPAASERPFTLEKGSGKILIMDDDEAIRETVSEMLKACGYSVTCAIDGRHALQIVVDSTEKGDHFRSIILDLTVPGGMGGKEAVVKIRDFDSTVPIFVSSGYAEDPVIANPTRFGFTDSICKPFTKLELLAVIGRHLQEGPADAISRKQ